MAMDTLRGSFDSGEPADGRDHADDRDWSDDARETESVRELPPEAIGQDERRMQVRAYNHWASLLGESVFPSIEELEPHDLPDFGPHSVLLDFSAGIEDPVVQYLGAKLAEECGTDGQIERLSDVPPRSLLSRITDHYMQIMANQAPIGFEAEFVNQRGSSILYRGILLPFSSDDETIDFIYGVINWKEMADQATADELLLEIDQALEASKDDPEPSAYQRPADPVTDWADSPAHEEGEVEASPPAPEDNVAGFDVPADFQLGAGDDDLPTPDFGQYMLDDPEDEEEEDVGTSYGFASLSDYIEAPSKKAVDLEADQFDPEDYRVENFAGAQPVDPEEAPVAEKAGAEEAVLEESTEPAFDQSIPAPIEPVADEPIEEPQFPAAPQPEIAHDPLPTFDDASPAGLHDCLASARELAHAALASEDRSRQALYAAVGRAYDFSLAASEEPGAYNTLIEQSGLTVQDRAPMTPVVKLVFGSDYDKTRLTEYAAVLSHAHRLDLERGSLAQFLCDADGGLKGVVKAERRLRREESGKEVEPEEHIRAALAEKLRELEALTFEAISTEGPEFALVMVRRDGQGRVDVLGEVGDDKTLIERAGRKLVG